MLSLQRATGSFFLFFAVGCSDVIQSGGAASSMKAASAFQSEVQKYLDDYGLAYQKLYTASNEAEWTSQTHIVAGDDTNARRTRAANEASAAFTGSVENIESSRRYLARARELRPQQKRELESILFKAGGNPATVPDLVKEKIAADAAQTEKLYGFAFELDGKELTPNDIDKGLREEKDLGKRKAIWETSKAVGPALREGLVQLRKLRNETVRALGYKDFFAYMTSEYGMSTEEMAGKIAEINRELRPLFRELHTYMRYELAERYGKAVPDLIPAHWLPNRWGQDWAALVDVPGYDLDKAMADKTPEWVIQQAERFYVSLGFGPLPRSFWEKSSLYPVPAGETYKKNTHASAWHIDLDRDVRALMSLENNTEWYETTHHELGHVYYYLTYSNPDVPLLLREGANRAYHEAMGSLMGLAAMQPRFISRVGLSTGDTKPDPMQILFKEALKYVTFIPWSTGTMFFWEKEIYADELPPEKWNARWWELAGKYQGIAAPSPRGEEFCDPVTKTHINDDPAGYYDYALSFVLLFQIHDHIAKVILHEDPHDTNYFGSAAVGEFLRSIMRPGSNADWRQLLRDKTGSDLSAKAMVDYFEPLRRWLVGKNKGRKYTLSEI